MKKVKKSLIRTNRTGKIIYEEAEELVDHEDGSLSETKREHYQGEPLEKIIFDQFMAMEKEKNVLLQSGALDKASGIMLIREYIRMKTFNNLKKLQKRILGD